MMSVSCALSFSSRGQSESSLTSWQGADRYISDMSSSVISGQHGNLSRSAGWRFQWPFRPSRCRLAGSMVRHRPVSSEMLISTERSPGRPRRTVSMQASSQGCGRESTASFGQLRHRRSSDGSSNRNMYRLASSSCGQWRAENIIIKSLHQLRRIFQPFQSILKSNKSSLLKYIFTVIIIFTYNVHIQIGASDPRETA